MSDLEFNGKLVNAVSHITIQSYGSSRYTLYPKSFGNAGGLVTILALGESSGNGSRTKVNNLGLTLNNLIFDGSKLNSNGTGFLITCHNEATGDCLRLGDNTTFQNFYLLKLLDCQNMRFEMAKTVKIINNRFATVGVNIGGGLDFSISGEISGNTITTLNDYNGCLVIGGMVPGSSISDLTIKNNSVTTNNGAVWLGNAKAKGIVYSGGFSFTITLIQIKHRET